MASSVSASGAGSGGSTATSAQLMHLCPAPRRKLVQFILSLYDNTLAGESSRPDPAQSPPKAAYPPLHGVDDSEFLAQDVVFRDPLIECRGLENYRIQFGTLHSTFPDVRMQLLSICVGGGCTMAGVEGPRGSLQKGEVIQIESIVSFKLIRWVQPKIRMVSEKGTEREGGAVKHSTLDDLLTPSLLLPPFAFRRLAWASTLKARSRVTRMCGASPTCSRRCH